MATLRVLSSDGDTPTAFTVDAHAEAEALFKRLRTTHTAFRVVPDAPAQRLDKFDPTAEEILLVPKVQGG